ncbi:hypothetical protein [Vibrio vulnificus]|nr:hypothetical protein [Vibrio vulnificus]MCG6288886.1 hypothetical protein [Vibrio vulnificus]
MSCCQIMVTTAARFAGKPTSEWQLDPSRLGELYLLPPLDFSGDIFADY